MGASTNCRSCGEANRDGAAFCGSCGTPLHRLCTSCRAELPATLKFCDQCGTPVAPGPSGSAGERKVVTILFADLSGSTRMQERLDAEATARVMERVQQTLAAAVSANGGRVVKSMGDGLMAVFGAPVVREDDAVRAVRAGSDMQAAFAALNIHDVALRVGINTGEVVVSPDSNDIVGDPVNVAARLEGAAGLGEVLVGPETTRLVRDVIPLEPVEPLHLKGRTEPVPAARVRAPTASAGAGSASPAGATPSPATSFLGREGDLTMLTEALGEAEAMGAARLVTVVGWPGLGKSRLAAEFAAAVAGRATVIEARFVSGGGSSFGPIAAALRDLVESDDLDFGDDRERVAGTVAALIRGGQAGSTEQVFWAIRRALQAAAAERPVVVVFDDIHWAETAMLDLIEHLAEWLSGGPVLLLALARPELHDKRPALLEAGGPSTAVRVLEGLDTDSCRALALEVLDADEVPDEVVRRVLAGSEGNPLFLRELLRLLVDDGVLQRAPDATTRRWSLTVELDAIELPATIHAALAARIEQLEPDERAVLQAASVIGRHFERGAVAALAPPAIAARLDDHLASLHRRALIDPDGTWWRDERLFRFHHVLIRDAAYRRVLKEVRATQHVRYADWLLERLGDDTAEHDEVLAYHLEQAFAYQRELGGTADPTLAQRAVAHLRTAGARALARDDVANASALLDRARQLAPDDVELLRSWCEAVVSTGDVHAATMAVSELAAAARNDRESAVADVYDAQLAGQRTPEKLREVVGRASAAAQVLAEHSDDVGVAHAESVHASALAGLGQVGAAEAALDRSLAAARRAGDIRRANVVLSLAPAAAVWGPSPIARASGRCLDVVRVLRITTWAPHVEAHALRHQAALEAMRQRGDAARNMLASARQTFTDLGHRLGLLETAMYEGLVELIDGQPTEAEAPLRKAIEGFDALGARTSAARATALLARGLLELDRVEEAARMADPLLSGEDLKAKIGLLGVGAEVLARRGSIAEAEGLARGAVALAETTDALVDHADARLALAHVLAAAGRGDESRAEMARARELYEAKGATAGMAKTEGGSVRAPVPAPVVEGASDAAVQRRVEPNDTIRLIGPWERAMRDGDREALASLYAPDFVYDDHTIRTGEAVRSHVHGLSASARAAMKIVNEPLASLGRRHALWRATATTRGDDGELVTEAVRLNVANTDNEGRLLHVDAFGDHAMNEALACLVERWATEECDGQDRERAMTTAETFRLATGPANYVEWDRYADIFEGGCILVDHRAHGHEVRGRDDVVDFVRSFVESTDQIVMRIVDVLALTPNGTLWRWEAIGELGGGEFALPALLVAQVGLSGRLRRLELFRPDDIEAAWDCFDRLTMRDERRVRANLATAAYRRWSETAASGDPAARSSLDAPGYMRFDHALMAELPGRRDDLVSQGYRICEANFEPLASLGERHALCRMRVRWEDVAGNEVDFNRLAVTRVDERGLVLRDDLFDADRLPEALSCLVERWAEDETAGENQERASTVARTCLAPRGQDAKDWVAYADLYEPDAVLVDCRPGGSKVIGGPEAVVEWLAALAEVGEELHNDIVDVIALTPRAYVWRWRASGISAGGEFELPSLIVGRWGSTGRMARVELYSVDDFAKAMAAFDNLDAPDLGVCGRSRSLRPNAASELATRWAEAFNRGALEEANALRAVGYERIDHFWHHVVDRPAAVSLDEVTSVDGRAHVELLATLGQRHVLSHLRFVVGEAVTERYFLTRATADGKQIERDELFGPDALAEALTCLTERWAEVEAEAHDRARADRIARWWSFGDLVAAGDWDAYRGLLSEDALLFDHRSNEEMRGADQGTAWIRELAAITTSIRIRPADVLALEPDVALIENVVTGEAAGGTFDRSSYLVVHFGGDGLVDRGEMFPLERLDDAWACFDRLATLGGAAAPAHVDGPAPTTATRAALAWAAALEQGDPYLVTGMLAAMSIAGAPRVESVLTSPVATRGDNVALATVRVRFGTSAVVDVELLAVFTVHDNGELAELVVFERNAEDDAYDALERAALDSLSPDKRAAAAACNEITAAYNSGDIERLRRAFTPGARIVDRRPVGWGDLDVDSYLTGVTSLRQRSPDARMRVLEWLDMDAGRVVMRLRVDGTSDGAAFETPITSVRWCEGDRVSRIELYDVSEGQAVIGLSVAEIS